MSEPRALCEVLTWDSEFFGFRIGRVLDGILDDAGAVDAWAERERVACLYFQAHSNEQRSIRLAEDNGFRLREVRMTFERSPQGAPVPDAPPVVIRSFAPADLHALLQIAGKSFHDSRFYQDEHFPRDKCDAFYQKWTQNSCHGYADAVLVAEIQADPAGYVTCRVDNNIGKVELIAVDSAATGQGIGTALILATLAWFAAKGVQRVTVATQGRNIPAQRLYQRCGFVVAGCSLYFHKHYS